MIAESSTTEVSMSDLLPHENEAADDPKPSANDATLPPDGGYGWAVAVFFRPCLCFGQCLFLWSLSMPLTAIKAQWLELDLLVLL